MQYPKPLSEKTLQKKYAELNMGEKKIRFMKDLLLACTNYYGCISLRDVWEVYKKLAEKGALPKISRMDIIRLSDVLRRDSLPYYVYEVDELYSAEKRTELERQFVSGYLTMKGYGKLNYYYMVAERQAGYELYVPADLLSYVESRPTSEDGKLLMFFKKLKVTEDEYENERGIKKKCSGHKGETLDSFSFMNSYEDFEYRWEKGEFEEHKGNQKDAQRLLDENNSMSEAEKLVKKINWYKNIGHVSMTDMIRHILEELQEVGVAISEKQLDQFLVLIREHNNKTPHMCLRGWRPEDLYKAAGRPTSISFGPGWKQAFADGSMDQGKLAQDLRKMGIEVVDETE